MGLREIGAQICPLIRAAAAAAAGPKRQFLQ